MRIILMKELEVERLKKLKQYEYNLGKEGYKIICGADEAGRGPLAGPVSVGVVVMKPDSMLEWVNDSKKVTERRREILYDRIIEDSLAWSVNLVSQQEIDELNILEATKKGLTYAIKDVIEQLKQKPDILIVDALREIDTCGITYQSIIKGDANCYSISCASILAKVTRDRIMREWDEIYPQYGFAKNKGYGTAAHIAAIKEFGPCPLHRKSFIKNFI
ncbi:MAG: ribonuclease HII [Clostridia bacterium]|nr:ribonuclease HII [Clostridia bacterium]